MSGGEGGTAQAEQPSRQPAQASYRRPTPEVKMTERREQPMMLTDPAFKEMVNLLAQQLDVQKKQLEKGDKEENETPEIATDFSDPHAREMAAM